GATTKTSASRARQNDPSTIRVRRAHAPTVLAKCDRERTVGPEQQLAHLVFVEEIAPAGAKADERAVVGKHAAEIRHVASVNEDGSLRQVEDEVPAPVVLVQENAAVLTKRVERGRGGHNIGRKELGQKAGRVEKVLARRSGELERRWVQERDRDARDRGESQRQSTASSSQDRLDREDGDYGEAEQIAAMQIRPHEEERREDQQPAREAGGQ